MCLKHFILLCSFFSAGILSGYAQTKDTTSCKSPCALPEANKFDFLLGKWKLTWNDSLSGVKTVTKELDGCAVYENYIDDAKTGNYKAISYTVYNQWAKKFSQTMIDNKGYFMISTGEWKENKMFFTHSYKTSEGKVQMQRQHKA